MLIPPNQKGVSLVEAMIAIVIFMIIMIGGHSYFARSHMVMAYGKLQRLAVAAAVHKMESLVKLDYSSLSSSLNETDVTIDLGNRSGTRSTTITYIDDAADGQAGADSDGNTLDYKMIAVEIAWSDSREQSYSLSTFVIE
ncbi:MAG: hypothetical protein DWQ05_18860 [Calditrichaeota bacterium]|nr:MAG: hypothetical protein DWQ05_18860 [Calditrichota bacterium]